MPQKQKPSRFTARGFLHTFSFSIFILTFRSCVSVTHGINHVILITVANLDHFVYKNKKL